MGVHSFNELTPKEIFEQQVLLQKFGETRNWTYDFSVQNQLSLPLGNLFRGSKSNGIKTNRSNLTFSALLAQNIAKLFDFVEVVLDAAAVGQVFQLRDGLDEGVVSRQGLGDNVGQVDALRK